MWRTPQTCQSPGRSRQDCVPGQASVLTVTALEEATPARGAWMQGPGRNWTVPETCSRSVDELDEGPLSQDIREGQGESPPFADAPADPFPMRPAQVALVTAASAIA